MAQLKPMELTGLKVIGSVTRFKDHEYPRPSLPVLKKEDVDEPLVIIPNSIEGNIVHPAEIVDFNSLGGNMPWLARYQFFGDRFDAKPGHVLWMESKGKPHYEPEADAREQFKNFRLQFNRCRQEAESAISQAEIKMSPSTYQQAWAHIQSALDNLQICSRSALTTVDKMEALRHLAYARRLNREPDEANRIENDLAAIEQSYQPGENVDHLLRMFNLD